MSTWASTSLRMPSSTTNRIDARSGKLLPGSVVILVPARSDVGAQITRTADQPGSHRSNRSRWLPDSIKSGAIAGSNAGSRRRLATAAARPSALHVRTICCFRRVRSKLDARRVGDAGLSSYRQPVMRALGQRGAGVARDAVGIRPLAARGPTSSRPEPIPDSGATARSRPPELFLERPGSDPP